MSLAIDPWLARELSPMVQSSLSELPEEKQTQFSAEYMRRRKGTALYVILAIFFPIQLFLLGKIGLGIVYWLTGGGFFVWYVIEWFLTAGRVRNVNNEIAMSVMRDIKILS